MRTKRASIEKEPCNISSTASDSDSSDAILNDLILPPAKSYRPMLMRLQAGLIILIALLNIADGVLTYLGLTFYEVAEANPVLDVFSSRLGLGSAIIFIKAIIISGLVLMFIKRSCIRCYTNITTLFLTNVFYLWVVGNNTDLILFNNFYQ